MQIAKVSHDGAFGHQLRDSTATCGAIAFCIAALSRSSACEPHRSSHAKLLVLGKKNRTVLHGVRKRIHMRIYARAVRTALERIACVYHIVRKFGSTQATVRVLVPYCTTRGRDVSFSIEGPASQKRGSSGARALRILQAAHIKAIELNLDDERRRAGSRGRASAASAACWTERGIPRMRACNVRLDRPMLAKDGDSSADPVSQVNCTRDMLASTNRRPCTASLTARHGTRRVIVRCGLCGGVSRHRTARLRQTGSID